MQKPFDFLGQLLTPTRAKILRLFIVYSKEEFVFAELVRRCGLPSRVVLNETTALLKMGIVRVADGEGKSARMRKKNATYRFDDSFKYANVLSTFVHEVSPERFNDVEKALRGAGRLNAIVLSGIFTGDVNRPADLIVVGDFVNEKRLEKVVKSFEPRFGREIRYAVFSTPEFRYRLTIHDKLVRDTLDYPHRLLLNKNNLI